MQFLDRLCECFGVLSRYQAHGVKRLIVGVDPQAVNRQDPWMFQPRGDQRFLEKSFLITLIVGTIGLDLFKSDFTRKFFVPSYQDSTHAPWAI